MNVCIMNNVTHIYTHITYTHMHTQMQNANLLLPLRVTLTWRSQAACALSRHCEPMLANSWSRARNSQEDWSYLPDRGVGTRSPTWTRAGMRNGQWICTPENSRSPFTAGWTGGLVWDGLLTPRKNDSPYPHWGLCGLNSQPYGHEPKS